MFDVPLKIYMFVVKNSIYDFKIISYEPKMEKNPVISISINSLFPHKIAEICIKLRMKLIHFSTDCVFSGTKGNYLETDLSDATDIC